MIMAGSPSCAEMKTGSAGGTVHFPREKAKAWPFPEKNERGQARRAPGVVENVEIKQEL